MLATNLALFIGVIYFIHFYRKSVNVKKNEGKSSKVNEVIFFSVPISMPNMKALAQVLFAISCTQDFQILLSQEQNSKRHNLVMKKKIK